MRPELGAAPLRVRRLPMSIPGQTPCGAPSRELIEFVLSAERRGFCRWRVATALGISAAGLAVIKHAAPTPGGVEADQQFPPWR